MRYIGGKSLLAQNILDVIREIAPEAKSVIDVFAGSGAVSAALKQAGYRVYANDMLYFSYVLSRGTHDLSAIPSFAGLGIADPIAYLNSLRIEDTEFSLEDCFVFQNYSPNETCSRMYFQSKNAIRIDIIRMTIEKWRRDKKITEDEYYYLLASLISAVPYISNITGVYAAYLKFWDKRSYNDLVLVPPLLVGDKGVCLSYNFPCNELLTRVKADVLYADPPYNSRQYLPNYHILETIARYDRPEIHGVSGMREYSNQKSAFCQKALAKEAFREMISKADVRYVVISYNNEGLLSTEELSEICRDYAKEGVFKLIETGYRRYKSKIPNKSEGLKEQLYVFEKAPNETKKYAKSPLNYTGGKYRLLPQLMELFPKHMGTMVDLFAGGCDVCANISAKHMAEKVLANDINSYIIGIYKAMQGLTIEKLLGYIETTISQAGLSSCNREAYEAFRKKYNESLDKNPLDLYILLCFSFNHQCRFNSRHDFNAPFGKDRSSFNPTMRENLIRFHENIQNISFSSENFRVYDLSTLKAGDFVYADPPYLITTGSYNDGKRGFEGWNQKDDLALFQILDGLDKRGVGFALSNVFIHKGRQNEALMEWSRKYRVHYLNCSYRNCSYHGKDKDKETVEVLVTNKNF